MRLSLGLVELQRWGETAGMGPELCNNEGYCKVTGSCASTERKECDRNEDGDGGGQLVSTH